MMRLVANIDADMFEHSTVGLERQLARRPGIRHVEVDRRTHVVVVDFDDARLKGTDVHRFIAESGYLGYCPDHSHG